ncbi:MAG: prepilin-type N-terminal cleavage/methylation domain-containing protein [Candidatus Daviesbacteria bacterium]|nr:prepilin-type N-terminal cleavage/methylation domain-containing protein [Candidatus Daviesbacteria bacterium]
MLKRKGFTLVRSAKVNTLGFTLIELLVTISIIAILSAIGMVAYSSVMKQGRDSKRQSDLRSIQSALEQYYFDQGFYPGSPGMNFILYNSGSFTSNTGISPPPSPPPAKIYINSPPKDPTHYDYITIPDSCDNNGLNRCTSYCLYATLDNLSTPAPVPSGCRAYWADRNFVVTPP